MGNNIPSLSGLKILVVDDEEDVLTLTRQILGLFGAEVITSPTAAQGLEQVQMQRPDAIISDISMAHMDGYEFIQAVWNLAPHNGRDTPAMAVTAFDRPQDLARAFNAGFQAHLSKPVSLNMLIETLADITNLPGNLHD
jgi:CheY-like chemotaxis protein